MPVAKLIRKRLPEMLVEEGVLKDEQVAEIHRHMRATGEGFIDLLVKLGLATDMDVARVVTKQSGLPFIDAARYRIDRDVLKGVPVDFMRQNQVVILDKIGKTLLVAVAGVSSPEVYEKIEKATGSALFIYVTTARQVAEALDKHSPQAAKPGAKPAAPAAAPAPKAPSPASTGVRPAAPGAGVTPNPAVGGVVKPPSGTLVRPAPAPGRPAEKK
jgi:hypothetical protein